MPVSVAVAVDCALRLRTFAQKVLNLRAKAKFLMHIRPFIVSAARLFVHFQLFQLAKIGARIAVCADGR